MANDINSVVLVGRITRDCELKYTQGGTAVAKGSVAVNRYGGKDNDEEVSFIDFAIWGKVAEAIGAYLTKGRQICINGELRQDRWVQDGQSRSRVEVVAKDVQLLGGVPQDKVQQSPAPQVGQVTRPTTTSAATMQEHIVQPYMPGPEQFDDDIPF